MEFYELFNIGSVQYVITIEGVHFKNLIIREYGTKNLVQICFWDSISELFSELYRKESVTPEDQIDFEDLFQEDFADLVKTNNQFTQVFTRYIRSKFNKETKIKSISLDYFNANYCIGVEDDGLLDVELLRSLTKNITI